MNHARFRPVLAIEVFGLLTSPVRVDTGEPMFPNSRLADVAFSRDRWPRTISEPEWGEHGCSAKRYCFNQAGIGWVLDMIERGYEVVWSSVWWQYVHTYFGELLGLPHLPNVFDPVGRSNMTLADVKIASLADRYPGRPILLTLDFPASAGGEALGLARHPYERPLSRVECFPWFSTAMPAALDSMTLWLTLTTTPEGQRELVRLRENELRGDVRCNDETPG